MSDLLAERLAHGGVLVVKDSLAVSGMFLMASLLRRALQDGQQAVLVLVDHTFTHYQQMLRKLGCNLIACRDSGQLVLVDVLASQLDWDAPAALQQLYGLIRSAVMSSQAAAGGPSSAAPSQATLGGGSHSSMPQQDPQIVPCTVFCDGLSSLAALVDDSGGSFEAAAQGHSHSTLGGGFQSPWTAFMHYMVLMGQGSGHGAASAVVALVHADIAADQQWQRVLDYGSDTIVAVHALESGHSADVSGEMNVLRRTEPVLADEAASQGADGGSRKRERVSAFYYRTTDNAVTFVRKPYS